MRGPEDFDASMRILERALADALWEAESHRGAIEVLTRWKEAAEREGSR